MDNSCKILAERYFNLRLKNEDIFSWLIWKSMTDVKNTGDKNLGIYRKMKEVKSLKLEMFSRMRHKNCFSFLLERARTISKLCAVTEVEIIAFSIFGFETSLRQRLADKIAEML